MGTFYSGRDMKRLDNQVKTSPREGRMCGSATFLVTTSRQNVAEDKFPRTQFIYKIIQALVGT